MASGEVPGGRRIAFLWDGAEQAENRMQVAAGRSPGPPDGRTETTYMTSPGSSPAAEGGRCAPGATDAGATEAVATDVASATSARRPAGPRRIRPNSARPAFLVIAGITIVAIALFAGVPSIGPWLGLGTDRAAKRLLREARAELRAGNPERAADALIALWEDRAIYSGVEEAALKRDLIDACVAAGWKALARVDTVAATRYAQVLEGLDLDPPDRERAAPICGALHLHRALAG
jgi:hypothetical protein